jgi:pimeloyl-ACP methyl ester carboxylesterase
MAPFAGAPVTVPALFIAGERDLVLAFPGMDRLLPSLAKFVPQLRRTIILPGCGHWTQQERPAEVNAAMIDFVRNL